MPRYFLHQKFGDEFVEDFEGADFEDLEAAQSEAVYAAHELMADRLKFGRSVQPFVFEIWDDNGHKLSEMPFLDAARSCLPRGTPRFKVTL